MARKVSHPREVKLYSKNGRMFVDPREFAVSAKGESLIQKLERSSIYQRIVKNRIRTEATEAN